MAKEKADRIRELSKKWLETGDDSLLDQIDDITKEIVDRPVPKKRILERYVDSVLDIHIHLHFSGVEVGISRTELNPHETCAMVQKLPEAAPVNRPGCRHVWMNCFGEKFRSADCCNSQSAMLINVHEMIKTQQGFRLNRIDSVVRLQPLDLCNRLRQDAMKPMPRHLVVKDVLTTTDRELTHVSKSREIGGRAGVDLNKLPDKMVKRGSKVVETIANDRTQIQSGIGEVGKEIDAGIAVIVDVLLSQEAAFFLVSRDLYPYRVEMMFSPDDFFPDSVERMIHDKENTKDAKGP